MSDNEDEYRKALGRRLRQSWQDAGFETAIDFLSTAGIPERMISKYYKWQGGFHEPTPRYLVLLARAAGVTVDWLVMGEISEAVASWAKRNPHVRQQVVHRIAGMNLPESVDDTTLNMLAVLLQK